MPFRRSASPEWKNSHYISNSLLHTYRIARRHPRSRRLGRYVSRHPCIFAIFFLLLSLGCFAIAWALSLHNSARKSSLDIADRTRVHVKPVALEAKFQPSWRKWTALASGTPPLIDRSFLRRLGFDEAAMDADLENEQSFRSPEYRPVAIYDVPESDVSIRPASYFDEETYDTSFCTYHPCRLLLATLIPDQGTGAQLYFRQIVKLAEQLNRTLVLPNVGKHRMGICYKHAFATYYDVRPLLDDCSLGLQAVTFGDFARWVAGRLRSPSAQIVIINSESFPDPDITNSAEFASASEALDKRPDRAKSKHNNCLGAKAPRLQLHNFPPMVLTRPTSSFGARFQEQNFSAAFSSYVLHALRSPNFAMQQHHGAGNEETHHLEGTAMSPDVLAIDWDLRELLFDATDLNLDYSPRLMKFAADVFPHTGPFLAVYWHLDSVEPDNLSLCAEALVQALQGLLLDPDLIGSSDVRTVWLNDGYHNILQNQTIHPDANVVRLTPEQDRAMSILQQAFGQDGRLQRFQFQSMSEVISAMSRDSSDRLPDSSVLGEPGVLGIVETILSTKANVFVTGAGLCSKSRFGFDEQYKCEVVLIDPL